MTKGITMKGISGKKGFTLIEMLLVLTLIGAIVGVALPSFKSMQDEGNIGRAVGDLRTLKTAMESYYIHNDNTYPDELNDLTEEEPGVIIHIPKDPFSGEEYKLTPGGDNNEYYIISSVGPDREDGGLSVDENGVDTNGSDDVWVSNLLEADAGN